ncbi:MAG: glutathione-regulated potassium-efflux system protein KefC [Alphaproteobacteria bacterium]|nr:glutathione-regulated potassium-efflux system protein KefC [Alphaproteobacteria bacterium]
MTELGFLESVLVYLTAAVIAVPIFKKLGLGSVLGYLVAGMAIGPWGMKLISDVETIFHFSEFGVVLLMFLIGLELKPATLWQLRHPVFGVGGAQVILSSLLLCLCAVLLGMPLLVALVAALALTMSSTPIAIQSLEERGLLKSETGQLTFSVLLFQDLGVIPVLAIVPLLGQQAFSEAASFGDFLKPFAVILLIVVGGRYLLRPIFRFIADSRMREVFTAFSLLLVVGSALLMEAVGISMALGTFLAGILLAESEYRHELELNLEPFKGLLLGLFFIAVGMSVDFSLLLADPFRLLALLAGFVAVKMMVLLALARTARLSVSDGWLFAFLLSQGGEFAFVMISVAAQVSLVPANIAGVLVILATFSMLTTPLLLFLYDRFICPKLCKEQTFESDVRDEGSTVIIAGYGRFGQIIGRLMMSLGIPITVLDHNPNHIEMLRKFGFKVFYGDASRLDLLEKAGAKNARLLVLAIDDSEVLLETAKLVRSKYPDLTILARAYGRGDVSNLREVGVTLVRRETFSSALEVGELALRELGFGAHQAHQAAQKFRGYDEKMLQDSYQFRGDQKKAIDYAIKSRQQLERLMRADQDEKASGSKDWA